MPSPRTSASFHGVEKGVDHEAAVLLGDPWADRIGGPLNEIDFGHIFLPRYQMCGQFLSLSTLDPPLPKPGAAPESGGVSAVEAIRTVFGTASGAGKATESPSAAGTGPDSACPAPGVGGPRPASGAPGPSKRLDALPAPPPLGVTEPAAVSRTREL